MKIKSPILLFTIFICHCALGQIKVEDLKVDTTITGFHFAANFQGTYIYTPNGKADLNTINPSAFSFSILRNATYQSALEQIDQLLSMSTQNGYTQTDIVRKDTTINGYKAYCVSLKETQKGTNYKNLVFHAFYIKDNTALIFASGDLNDGKYIENFKKTFYSTRL